VRRPSAHAGPPATGAQAERDARPGCRAVLALRGIRPPETGPAAALFTHSGSWGDISLIVRRQTGAEERENGQIVRRNAAWGG